MPSFAADIRSLFRDGDVEAMLYRLDLRSYNDVSEHADAIWERVEDGSMPCDDMWPLETVELFRRWVDTGKAP